MFLLSSSFGTKQPREKTFKILGGGTQRLYRLKERQNKEETKEHVIEDRIEIPCKSKTCDPESRWQNTNPGRTRDIALRKLYIDYRTDKTRKEQRKWTVEGRIEIPNKS